MKDFYFSNEDDEKEFLKNKKWLIHSLIIDAVKIAIEGDLENVVVFRIINPVSNFIMTSELKKKDWLESLGKSLSFYESVEEYEYCKEIKDLISKIENGNIKSNKGKEKN